MDTNLGKIRKDSGVTQTDLAAAIEVSRQTIHSIETLKYTPSVELALKIAKFFELNVEDIFCLSEPKRRKK